MTLKLVFTASLRDTRYLRDSLKNKPASILVVSLGKALCGIPHLCVVDRWLATPKRARIALRSLSRDRRIDMQLNTKNLKWFNPQRTGRLA